LDHGTGGLERESAVNCDGLHTVPQARLTKRIGEIDHHALECVCAALTYALGC
jgi:mRNA-degrading endonuclease toxin of MazEF toxin-antitoxin module